MNKLQKFMEYNGLDLTGSGSDLNSTCCIIAGYALHLNGDSNDYNQVLTDIEEDGLHDLTSEASDELERVFDYAYQNNYARFWTTEDAKKQYVF